MAVFCWITNAHAISFSISALSESMFTAFGLASLLFLVHANRKPTHTAACWAGSVAMAGASYWVRYAGLLWVLACFAVIYWQLTKTKWRAFLRPVLFTGALAVLFLTPLLVRNVILVGDPRGGNNTPISRPPATLVMETPGIVYRLIMGEGDPSRLWLSCAFVATGLIGLCINASGGHVTKVQAQVKRTYSRVSRAPNWAIVLAALFIYVTCVAVISTRSPTSYSPRMFFPGLPHYLALAVCGLAFLMRRGLARGYSRTAFVAFGLCALSGYAMSNIISGMPDGPGIYQRTVTALLGPDEEGRSLRKILDQELKPGEVIAATDGQAAGYILRHPTLALAGHPYTVLTWNARELKTQLARFRAGHLLVFRNSKLDPVIDQSPFLEGLAAGDAPPWLRVAAFNREAYLYRVEPDETAAPTLAP
jgi:hypothetical protein